MISRNRAGGVAGRAVRPGGVGPPSPVRRSSTARLGRQGIITSLASHAGGPAPGRAAARPAPGTPCARDVLRLALQELRSGEWVTEPGRTARPETTGPARLTRGSFVNHAG